MELIEILSSAITVLFLLVVLSYYVLVLLPRKQRPVKRRFSSITVIIPAHNEERYIAACIDSVLSATFKGKKQIIVVDDGSKDSTATIVKGYRKQGVQLIQTKHTGKSASLNLVLRKAKGELIAIVDGDSSIRKDALVELTKEVGRENTVAATGVVRVKNRSKLICLWIHIEQLYNSLMRSLFSKVNANITTPGPLSMYRTKELRDAGGFSTQGFSEDLDITIRLIRKGYHIGYSDRAVADTNMPYEALWFFRQRMRFARGLVNILKRHMRMNTTLIDLYTLPLLLFTYIQGVIMGSFILYQVITGYMTYFVSKGVYISLPVIQFFFEWFSIIGFVKWAAGLIMGTTPFGIIALVGVISTLLTYPLYIFAILRYDRKFDIGHVVALFFMFPFWLLIMFIYILSLPEIFRSKQYNRWEKYD